MIRLHKRARIGARGFTLIELLVSMVAGLIVALAVVSLSKSVANQFYEEVRASAAETSVRLAAQRLRADISRAGLMTTGNIVSDPKTAHPVGGNGAKGEIELQHLSGIRIVTAGSLTPDNRFGLANVPAAPGTFAAQANAQAPVLTPDAFAVYGNLTSGDEYFGSVDPAAAGGCGGKAIRLNVDDPSLLRIINTPAGVALPVADATAALNQVFQPVAGQRFFARVTDTKGFSHFSTTCDPAVAFNAGIPYVFLRGTNATLTSLETNTQFGGVDGFETIAVAPVHGAYWFVGKVGGAGYAAAENNLNPFLSTHKFDLYRAWISASGGILVNSAEVVAEYAVDLKLGFTVDDPSQPDTTTTKARVFGFGGSAADRDPWANRDITSASAALGRGTMGPHRIRSVRYRLATRAATPDRDQGLAPPAGSDFLYRYRLENTNRFARARITQAEVALLNQARMNY